MPHDMSRLDATARILVFDQDEAWAASAKTLLENGIFATVVDVVTGDFSDCFTMVRKSMYAVAVINAHAVGNLDELRRFHIAAPATAIVAVSEKDDPDVIKLLFPPKPVAKYVFGSKNDVPIASLLQLVREYLKLTRMLSGELKINFPPDMTTFINSYTEARTDRRSLTRQVSPDVLLDELRYIVTQLFASPEGMPSITDEVTVELFDEAAAGRSGASLLRVTPVVLRENAQERNKSAVLKFGLKDDIGREVFNYDKYVDWFLAKDQTVLKKREAEANYFGGILYSYPRDIKGEYLTFSEFLRKRSVADCRALIKEMFEPTNKHWLSVRTEKLLPPEESLFQTYYVEHVLHAGIREMREKHFIEQFAGKILDIERVTNKNILRYSSDKITLEILNLSFPNPLKFIAEAHIDQLEMTVIHGDLHGENILVDEETGQYYFIDFFYTGPGHIYRDFIELELSVRYDLFSSKKLRDSERLTHAKSDKLNVDGLKRLVVFEQTLLDLAKGKEIHQQRLERLSATELKALKIIGDIRKFAFENSAEGNINHYYMGLVVSSMKALKYFYPIDVRIHRLFVSGLYLEALENGELS